MFDKYFNYKKNKTTYKTEVLAGVTTFLTMAYIMFLNPFILSGEFAGPEKGFFDFGAVFTATIVATAIACFITTGATHRAIQYGIAGISEVKQLTLEGTRRISFTTVHTQQTNKALSHDAQQRRGQQKRLYTHILQACYRPNGGIGVQR